MILVEKHIINFNHSYFKECEELCFLSKNLYNFSLYNIRQEFFNNKKYLCFAENYKLVKSSALYKSMPSRTSNQVLRILDQNFRSFFNLNKNNKKAKIPKYLDKNNGKFVVKYLPKSISIKQFKKTGLLFLSKTNIQINTKIKNFNLIKEVRVVPKNNYFKIEVVYEVKEKLLKSDNERYVSIDLGVNNLATLASNVIKPIIINGKPVKSINQYYNKQKAYLQSKLINNQKTSNRIKNLSLKRKNKIDDYFHKSTKYIVNQLVSNNINTLIIGYNKGWKQDINIGNINNQKFVSIPHLIFVKMLHYKCKLEGINVIETEESYTSKCSFLDHEEIKKHDKYLGKRISRGLFQSKNGIKINADVNGALNILKKVVSEAFKSVDEIEVSSKPSVYTVNYDKNYKTINYWNMKEVDV